VSAHGLPQIDAFVHPEDAASLRVLVKSGFQRVGFEPRLDRDR
jgi:RimJ/RimL family protein N-acetyltransferase